jgi:hypothetical protein
MSSDDLSGDDSDLAECVCGEVECLCVRGPGKLAGNPYAAYNSLPKRVSQPPKKTPGGIKQPKKKKPAAPKSRKSQQKASRDYNTAYMKALNATTDENRLLHQEEQAKQLGLILHTEEVLRSNQFLPFDPAASVLKSTQAFVALKKKKAKKKKEEEEAAAAAELAPESNGAS